MTKRSVCGFTSVSEAGNQKDRLEEIAMEGFLHIQNLGNILETHLDIPEDKQLPGTSCLAPRVIVGDEVFPLKTYLMIPYPGWQNKGDNEKSIFNYIFPDPEWWKMHLEY